MTFVYEKLLKEIELKFVHGQFIYNKFEFIDVFKNKFLPIKHLLNLLLDLIITIIYYFELRAQYIKTIILSVILVQTVNNSLRYCYSYLLRRFSPLV
jgi:hypothetical protein